MTTMSMTNIASTATLPEQAGNFSGFPKFVSVVLVRVSLSKKDSFG